MIHKDSHDGCTTDNEMGATPGGGGRFFTCNAETFHVFHQGRFILDSHFMNSEDSLDDDSLNSSELIPLYHDAFCLFLLKCNMRTGTSKTTQPSSTVPSQRPNSLHLVLSLPV